MTKRKKNGVNDEEKRSFVQLCDFVHRELGGRASAQAVAEKVYEHLDGDVYKSLTWGGFVSRVGSALHTKDSVGLARAACIEGTFVQRALWTTDDYRFVIADHVSRCRNENRLAYEYANECRTRTGTWIDPATVLDAPDEAAS